MLGGNVPDPATTAGEGSPAHAALARLRELIRVDTSNPPGREAEAAALVASWLRQDGLEPTVLEATPGRANVVARLRGSGELGPLLVGGHLDVVPADPAGWTHPPFSAEVAGGYVYGRGAVDMKHAVALAVTLVGCLRTAGVRLRRDIIFAAVADEEAGCDHGSRFLVDHHPDLVRAEYCLGEMGGYSTFIGGRAYYPVRVAEKGICWMRLRARGQGGHGSVPRPDSAVVRLCEAAARLGRTRLPQHECGAVSRFVREVASTQPLPARAALPLLLVPRAAGLVLDHLFPDPKLASAFAAMLANTATPTVLRAGEKVNVVPAEAELLVDGRTLPGQTADDLVREVQAVVGEDIEIEVLRAAPGVVTEPIDTPCYRAIERAIRRHDPGAQVVPYLMPAFSDAVSWSRLGTKCYGFTPIRFDASHQVRVPDLFHGDDERIPVDGFLWGYGAFEDVVRELCAA